MSAPSEVRASRSEFGFIPSLGSQKNWRYSISSLDDGSTALRLKDGGRVFAFRVGGDISGKGFAENTPLSMERLGDIGESDFLQGALANGVFQVHKSTPRSIHGTLQDGKSNLSVLMEADDSGTWTLKPKPKARLSQLAAQFASTMTSKEAGMKCPSCGSEPGKYRIHGDAIQCGQCEKTSDMEAWDKTASDGDRRKVYAVDLDGTLAYNDGRDFDPDHIGRPIKSMMRLVRLWLRRGHEVRIFTARAANKKNIPRIKEWLSENGLPDLEITNEKTPDITRLYDDRAVQVEENTGRLAKLSAVFGTAKVARKAVFRRPENYDKISDIPSLKVPGGAQGYYLMAGANDWENPFTWAGVLHDDDKSDMEGYPPEPRAWIEIDHSNCPACHGRDGHRDWKGCRKFSEGVIKRWLAGCDKKDDIEEELDTSAAQIDGVRSHGFRKREKASSKIAVLQQHFKGAISIPGMSALSKVPGIAGETASAISNGTFVQGAGTGSGALEKGINGVAGVTGGIDLLHSGLKTVAPLGAAVAAKAPGLSKGIGFVAKKIAPPVWAASMAYQTGQLAANPVQTANESLNELSEAPWYSRAWMGASNPPRAIAGAVKGVYDAGAAVAEGLAGEASFQLSRLKNWFSPPQPKPRIASPAQPPAVKKEAGLVGDYLKILRERFMSARSNVNTSPSKAQQDSGNYRKGHVWMQGLDITIENPKGSTRSGTDKKGRKWSVTMKNDYGYIRNHPRSQADGDHIDVFVGPHPTSEIVFVVDQDVDGKFDEHKCMCGFFTEKEAKDAYIANFDSNWKGFRSITALTMRQFKKWLTDGDTSKPLSGQQYRDFLKTAELEIAHDIKYPAAIGSIVRSPMLANPMVATVGGAARGVAVAGIIHAIRRLKRDAMDEGTKDLSLLKDLGTGAMIGAGTGLLAFAAPPLAEKVYDIMDPPSKSPRLQKLSQHFMDVVLAPVSASPAVAPIMGAGYGALAGGAKGVFRKAKSVITGDEVEPDAIKNDIIDGAAQGANYGAFFGLTGSNPPPATPRPEPSKIKKLRTSYPTRR
jgi:hypothetical protein